MRVPTIVKLILKSLIIPIVAVISLNYFNLFEYVVFVPEDYRYEVGLTVYLAISETIYGLIESWIERKQATVKCIFYVSDIDKDINNNPSIMCDSEGMGVASVNCYVELKGNLKKLRKCKISLKLPKWLSSQASTSDIVLNYSQNQLIWEFQSLLPETGIVEQIAEYKNKISFIRSTEDSSLSIILKPQMNKCLGVKFQTNCIKVQKGE